MRVGVAITLVMLVGGCAFDERGVPGGLAGADARMPGDGASGGADAATTDAGSPDAAVPCADRDHDGFFVVAIPDSDCGDQLDCDDGDDRAFPGQTDYFSTPRTSGGFDFNCDGNQTPIDTTQGGACQTDWWSCTGTGWVGGVPDCGNPGTYHTCEDQGGCTETSSVNTAMACR